MNFKELFQQEGLRKIKSAKMEVLNELLQEINLDKKELELIKDNANLSKTEKLLIIRELETLFYMIQIINKKILKIIKN